MSVSSVAIAYQHMHRAAAMSWETVTRHHYDIEILRTFGDSFAQHRLSLVLHHREDALNDVIARKLLL